MTVLIRLAQVEVEPARAAGYSICTAERRPGVDRATSTPRRRRAAEPRGQRRAARFIGGPNLGQLPSIARRLVRVNIKGPITVWAEGRDGPAPSTP
jgi:hypothetical protein